MRRTHYVIGERPKRFWQNYLLWIVLLLILAAAGGSWIVLNRKTETFIEPVAYIEASDVNAGLVDIETRILFAGDTIWGRYIDAWSQASPLKTAYPFSRLKELGTFDARIANLECPIVSGVHTSAAQQEATLLFNCPPEYVKEAAKLFTAFSLANNHTNNQGGQAGLEETRNHLEEGGIQHFGHFDPEVLDDVCEVISVPVRIANIAGQEQSGELPIAMCGYHGLATVPSPASVGQMTKYSEFIPTFAYPHMGAEYVDAPDSVRTALFRSMVDAGADSVFAGHPHWVQPAESYKGRLIAYSTGNFIFDQQYSAEVTRGANFGLTLSIDGISSADLEDWLELGSRCKKHKDDCLAQAKSENLGRLPWKFSYEVIASDSDGKITKPASKQTREAILKRLDWPKTIKLLKSRPTAEPS